MSGVRLTFTFSRAIEVLRSQRSEESRGLTVTGVDRVDGMLILCFILCMEAIPNAAGLRGVISTYGTCSIVSSNNKVITVIQSNNNIIDTL